jgi:hypothetical protein
MTGTFNGIKYYNYVSLKECVINHRKTILDAYPSSTLGRKEGILGDCIPYILTFLYPLDCIPYRLR